VSKLAGKLARLERTLRPGKQNTGSIEFHYPGGAPDPSGRSCPVTCATSTVLTAS